MRKPYQSPGRMKNSSYYIAPVGDRTHDLPHTVASNMVKMSHALNHSVFNLINVITAVSPGGSRTAGRVVSADHERRHCHMT